MQDQFFSLHVTKRPSEHGVPTVLAIQMRNREQGQGEEWQMVVLEIPAGRGSGGVGTWSLKVFPRPNKILGGTAYLFEGCIFLM